MIFLAELAFKSDRLLVKYLELAAEYSERKGVPITAEMLLQFRGRFEDGGAWEEDR